MTTHKIKIAEGIVFAGLLFLTNAGLCNGIPGSHWTLMPEAVAQGEWVRLLLHPWVHVSWYHLLLDATAFLSLYYMLDRRSKYEPELILLGSWLGASSLAWFLEPAIRQAGLCGLSGIAHGLFAAVCIQWLCKQNLHKAGSIMLAILLGKTILETITGQAFLGQWHFGDVGQPLVLCHAGGVLGGLIASGASGRHALAHMVNMRTRKP